MSEPAEVEPVGDEVLHPTVAAALRRYGLAYDVLECPDELADTAAFCAHFGFSLDDSANTLLVASRKVDPTRYAACVVLGTTRLDVNRAVCGLLGVKRASFADGETMARLTGMQVGGVTAPGIDDLAVYVDAAVMARQRVVMGGGNRTSKIVLSPAELTRLPNVEVVEGLAQPRDDRPGDDAG